MLAGALSKPVRRVGEARRRASIVFLAVVGTERNSIDEVSALDY